MRSANSIWRVAAMRFTTSLVSGRAALVALLMGIYAFSAVQPVADFARSVGERVTPYAPPFMINEHVCQLFLTLAAIALFSGAPYKDKLYPYVIARAGKAQMVVGNALGIIFIAFAYVAFLFVMMALPIVDILEFSPKWGRVWNTLAMYGMDPALGQVFPVTDAIRAGYTPAQAMLMSYLLESMCISFLGMCVYLGNQLTGRPVGLWACAGLVALDLMIYNTMPAALNRVSPLALARLTTYIRQYYMPMNSSVAYGFIFFGAGILIFAAIICVNERTRKNLM